MNRITQRTDITCDIVPRLSTRPGLTGRMQYLPVLATSVRVNESILELDGGDSEVHSRGPDRVDVSLSVDKLLDTDRAMLREIRQRKLPCYIYPRLSGTAQLYAPLKRGVGGDPSEGTYDGHVGSDTTLYLPRADSRYGYYLQEVSLSDMVLVDSVVTGRGASTEHPTGRALLLVQPRANLVANSLFGDLTLLVPADWTYTGTAGTDGGVLPEGWLGVPALWIWGTTQSWSSASMTPPNSTVVMALSYGWRCDGVVRVRCNFGAAGNVDFTHGPGSGYERQLVTVPAGSPGSVTIEVQSTSGTYCEFCAPQLIKETSTTDAWDHPVFMGSSGSGTYGSITSNSLKFTGIFGGDIYDDPMVAAACYVQPTFGGAAGGFRTMLHLRNTLTNHDISAMLYYSAGALKLYVTQDGSSFGTPATLTGHDEGKVYALVLYAGLDSGGTYYLGAVMHEVGEASPVASVETTGGGLIPYVNFDELYVGSTDGPAQWADSLFSEVRIMSIEYGDGADIAEQMAHLGMIDLYRETRGRLYHVVPELHRMRWNERYHQGAINGTQIEEL